MMGAGTAFPTPEQESQEGGQGGWKGPRLKLEAAGRTWRITGDGAPRLRGLPPPQSSSWGGRHHLSPLQCPSPVPPGVQSREGAWPSLRVCKARPGWRGQEGTHFFPPGPGADALGIGAFCFHVSLSHAGCVEHISQKILAFESCCHNNHFITRQAQYLRNAESSLKSVRCTSKGNRSSLFLHYFAGK